MSLSFHPDLQWSDAPSAPLAVPLACSWCGGPICRTADVLQLFYNRQALCLHGACFSWLVSHEELLYPMTPTQPG
jgi:hypothetical protein